jgi:hypothetical protein
MGGDTVATEAQKQAAKRYRKNTKKMQLEFSLAETELWEHIQKQPKKQTYIKDLIRTDMEKNK